MSDTIRITIDGQPTDVAPGTLVLAAARGLGVEVPTLCDHPSLDPSGACRLCVVEITHADWGGWSGLVTACLYPAEDGLQVSTTSPKVREARRGLLELYLARCPDAEAVRAAARREGVDTTPYPPRADADKCIQCGLCVRVCGDLSTRALAPLGRGTNKTVGPRPDKTAEDCVGCLACAEVCPTGEIAFTRTDGRLTIWNRDFPVPVCDVRTDSCRGCGACEEACPFDIPRVYATRGGGFVADISPHTCTGCGICAGACPTGAITQRHHPDAALIGAPDLRGRTITYACARSELGEGTDLIPVTCVGRVGVDDVLSCLARGADGVELMCRDRDTCPYGAGGELGEAQAATAGRIAEFVGLGTERVRYVRPRPGDGGPDLAAAAFRADLSPNPLAATCPPDLTAERGLDRALGVVRWLKARPELTPRLPDAVAGFFDTDPRAIDVLYLGDLVELDLLLDDLVADWRLRDTLAAAGALLATLGLKVRLAVTPRETEGAARVIVCEPNAGADLDGEAVTLDELAGRTQPGAAPFRFRITPEERRDLVAHLKTADVADLRAGPHALAQFKMLTRRGAWVEGRYAEHVLSFADKAEVDS
ncbi:4Fe-4S binding protein [bacterium]|nr:4Fe-4S binding protein [bacterium]